MMKKPESKNSETNRYTCKRIKRCAINSVSSPLSDKLKWEIWSVIKLSSCIREKHTSYPRETHIFLHWSPCKILPQFLLEGTLRNFRNIILSNIPTSHREVHRAVSYCGSPTTFAGNSLQSTISYSKTKLW